MNKYKIILGALVLLVLTSCNSTRPQRNTSSVASLDNIENFQASANYGGNLDVFKYQAGQFIMVANNPRFSGSQKQQQMNSILNTAVKSLNEQCDWVDELWTGCGLIKGQGDALIDQLRSDVQKNNFKGASQKASEIYHTYFRQ